MLIKEALGNKPLPEVLNQWRIKIYYVVSLGDIVLISVPALNTLTENHQKAT